MRSFSVTASETVLEIRELPIGVVPPESDNSWTVAESFKEFHQP